MSDIRRENGLKTVLANGKAIKAEQVMCALGRQPNTAHLNLDAVNLEIEKGKIVVDALKRTGIDNIFAIGDCTDTIMLTPVAKAEGEAAA